MKATRKGSRYVTFHSLLMRVDDLADLPSGVVLVRGEDGVLKANFTDKIPTTELQALISAGRVYAPWGQQVKEFEDLDSNWTRACAPATPAKEQRA